MRPRQRTHNNRFANGNDIGLRPIPKMGRGKEMRVKEKTILDEVLEKLDEMLVENKRLASITVCKCPSDCSDCYSEDSAREETHENFATDLAVLLDEARRDGAQLETILGCMQYQMIKMVQGAKFVGEVKNG